MSNRPTPVNAKPKRTKPKTKNTSELVALRKRSIVFNKLNTTATVGTAVLATASAFSGIWVPVLIASSLSWLTVAHLQNKNAVRLLQKEHSLMKEYGNLLNEAEFDAKTTGITRKTQISNASKNIACVALIGLTVFPVIGLVCVTIASTVNVLMQNLQKQAIAERSKIINTVTERFGSASLKDAKKNAPRFEKQGPPSPNANHVQHIPQTERPFREEKTSVLNSQLDVVITVSSRPEVQAPPIPPRKPKR